MVPAQPHLKSHWNVHRLDRRFNECQRMVEIAHQRRAREPFRHLFRGAAHIDVDDGGARGCGHPRAFAHPAGLAPGELDHHGRDVRTAGGAAHHISAAFHELFAGHHFRHHKPRAPAAGDATKRPIRHARHGRKDRRRRQRVVAHAHR